MRNPFLPLRRLAAFASRHHSSLLLAAALGFGALAVFGARGYLAERLEIEKARLAPTQPVVEVVVARRDLDAGDVVDADSMAVRQVPADLVPGSAVLPERFDRHVGARIAQPMRSGEPLLAATIVGADPATFSSRIRPGIRAMSVLVDEVNSVSGMLQPGDRIDLLFSVRPPVPPGMPPAQEITSTLMQDLAVLATGRQVRADRADSSGLRHFTAITVEVSPSQAQELIVAQRSGKLTAMLRNPEDRQPMRPRTMDLNALLGIDPPQRELVVPKASGPEIIVGGRGTLVAASRVVDVPVEGYRRLGSEWVSPPRLDALRASESILGGASSKDAQAPEADAIPAGHGVDEPAWALYRFGRGAPIGATAPQAAESP